MYISIYIYISFYNSRVSQQSSCAQAKCSGADIKAFHEGKTTLIKTSSLCKLESTLCKFFPGKNKLQVERRVLHTFCVARLLCLSKASISAEAHSNLPGVNNEYEGISFMNPRRCMN
jgi:hypothetical protein